MKMTEEELELRDWVYAPAAIAGLMANAAPVFVEMSHADLAANAFWVAHCMIVQRRRRSALCQNCGVGTVDLLCGPCRKDAQERETP